MRLHLSETASWQEVVTLADAIADRNARARHLLPFGSSEADVSTSPRQYALSVSADEWLREHAPNLHDAERGDLRRLDVLDRRTLKVHTASDPSHLVHAAREHNAQPSAVSRYSVATASIGADGQLEHETRLGRAYWCSCGCWEASQRYRVRRHHAKRLKLVAERNAQAIGRRQHFRADDLENLNGSHLAAFHYSELESQALYLETLATASCRCTPRGWSGHRSVSFVGRTDPKRPSNHAARKARTLVKRQGATSTRGRAVTPWRMSERSLYRATQAVAAEVTTLESILRTSAHDVPLELSDGTTVTVCHDMASVIDSHDRHLPIREYARRAALAGLSII